MATWVFRAFDESFQECLLRVNVSAAGDRIIVHLRRSSFFLCSHFATNSRASRAAVIGYSAKWGRIVRISMRGIRQELRWLIDPANALISFVLHFALL
jgi:hypothetical protein